MMRPFELTPKQAEAQKLFAGPAQHICLFGGSRSAKTFLIVRNIIFRALKAANTRHIIFRFRFNAVKASVMQDTFPKVLELAFPQVRCVVNKTDSYATFDNGSTIYFAGLDDKERTEKILGMEFATIFLNECSQIPQSSRDLTVTRLSQQGYQTIDGVDTVLKVRMYLDCNPPSKAHWIYKLFILKVDPDSKQPLTRPDDFVSFRMNPIDNLQNLSDDYLESLKGLPARLRKRFLEGEFADATPNALFTDENIDTWRVLDGSTPQLVRVVVAVDPSGADGNNEGNDAIGIVVAGLGIDGNAYILEDCTVKCAPAVWGKVATDAYDRWDADLIVGEVNYGGAMVKHVIQTARPRTPYATVTATRGKAVRAEPISALYEQGKVRHVGYFNNLEEELTGFSTFGYTGDKSPNAADAAIWGLSALFPGIVKPKAAKMQPKKLTQAIGWMG